MPTAREIKSHIHSVRSIAKVTRALETVSAVKNRRLQARLLSTRAYADKSWEVLSHLASAVARAREDPVFRGYSDVRSVGMLLITSDRGMVGAFNLEVVALATGFCQRSPQPVKLVTIGRIGRDAMLRQGYAVHADFSQPGDVPDLGSLALVAHVLLDGFRDRVFDKVVMVYAQFRSGAGIRPTIRQLLPASPAQTTLRREYIYEPEPEALLSALLPRLIRFQVYEALLQSVFAENVARMTAMHAATRNANDLLTNLTTTYNEARQQAITAEIIDVLGGAGASSGRQDL